MRRGPDLSLLRQAPLFDRYRDRELAPLARHVDRVTLTPGATLAREGRRSHEVAVVLTGEVAVRRGGAEVGRLGPGTVVGTRQELAAEPHDATLVAVTGVVALVMPGVAYRWAVRTLPHLAAATGPPPDDVQSQSRRRNSTYRPRVTAAMMSVDTMTPECSPLPGKGTFIP
jgi:CRP/FNR family transcriptional regulator, cyclic AMP receptor protein